MFLLSMCDKSYMLEIFLIIKIFLQLVCYIVPGIIIIVTIINLFKTIQSGKQDDMKDNLKIFARRIIAGLLVIFIPTLVNYVFTDLIDGSGVEILACMESATAEKVASLKEAEEAEAAAEAEAQAKEDEEAQKAAYEEEHKNDEAKKEAFENAKKSKSVSGNTQASEFYELGDRAYQGDTAAQQEWIEKLGPIVQKANKYGMKNSLIMAQIINESGWMRTPTSTNADGKSLVGSNNVIGINYDMGISTDKQDSTWSTKKTYIDTSVSVWNSSGTAIEYETQRMRAYASLEECIEDYADLIYVYHPECKGNNDIECYRSYLNGYTPRPSGMETITDYYKKVISKYNLERFDE